MPAITLGGSKSHAKVAAADGRYVGDTPQPQAFHVKFGKTWIFKSGSDTPSGSDQITIPLRVVETGKKAKFNGFTIWHRLTLGETSAPFVNAFLEAAGIDPAAVWEGRAKTNEKGQIVALKGVAALDSFSLLVGTKNHVHKGNRSLEVSGQAPWDGKSYENETVDDDYESDDFDDEDDDAEDEGEKSKDSDDDDDDAF